VTGSSAPATPCAPLEADVSNPHGRSNLARANSYGERKQPRRLAGEGINARVVSMPSWELFAAQDDAYRDDVLLPDVPSPVAAATVVDLPTR
jgi:hypothetical protein